MRSMRRSMCAAMLALQAVVLFLTTPVMISLGGIDAALAVSVGCGLAVVCLVVAGLLRKDWAYVPGFVIQIASVAMGMLVTPMYVLGVIFAALWVTAFVMGGRIDAAQSDAQSGAQSGAQSDAQSAAEADGPGVS